MIFFLHFERTFEKKVVTLPRIRKIESLWN